jgi:hypothetical protein
MSWGARVLDLTQRLHGGQEWAGAFHVYAHGVVNLTAAGTLGFYVGIYARADFDRIRRANPARFPFVLGSARLTHFLRVDVQPGDYVFIVRVTSWAGQRDGEVRVVVEFQA